jgi:hypothetical protein
MTAVRDKQTVASYMLSDKCSDPKKEFFPCILSLLVIFSP